MELQTRGNSKLSSNHLRALEADNPWPFSKHTTTDYEKEKHVKHVAPRCEYVLKLWTLLFLKAKRLTCVVIEHDTSVISYNITWTSKR